MYELIAIILTFIIGQFAVAKRGADKTEAVAKETAELFTAINIGIKDGITGDEIRQVIKEAKDIPNAVKDVRDKSISKTAKG